MPKKEITKRVLERLIQQVKPGQWQALEALDQKFDVVEQQLGFPVKRRYRSFASSGNTDTLVIEREWESLSVMKAAWEKLMTSAEYQKLDAEAQGILSSNAPEIFMVL